MTIAHIIPRRALPFYRRIKGNVRRCSIMVNYYAHECQCLKLKRIIHNKLIRGEQVRVGFVGYASAPSVDVFSGLYEVFNEDNRFQCEVVVIPYTHDDLDSMKKKYRNAIAYLQRRGISFLHGYNMEKDVYNNYEDAFDIVFFEIEYDWVRWEFKANNFRQALTYFIPYGPYIANNIAHHFSHSMMNEVHRVFPAAKNERPMLKKYSQIHGANICKQFLGYPKNDVFFRKGNKPNDVWIKAKPSQKRIIWAPHHTWADYSNFHTYADFFLSYAKAHKDVFVAFKPHPSLRDSLKNIDGWSEERIVEYYTEWQRGDNTSLFEGEWFDLFLTSDAMIMDSISFMLEYSLTGKPSCVLYREDANGNRVMLFSECGEILYKHLYHAKNVQEIIKFIEDVKEGVDPMAKGRVQYVLDNFVPPYGEFGSENIFRYIKKEIGIK